MGMGFLASQGATLNLGRSSLTLRGFMVPLATTAEPSSEEPQLPWIHPQSPLPARLTVA